MDRNGGYLEAEAAIDAEADMRETLKSVDETAGSRHETRISSLRFRAFLAAQFLGAANDSAFSAGFRPQRTCRRQC
jgi:hypothetical protein